MQIRIELEMLGDLVESRVWWYYLNWLFIFERFWFNICWALLMNSRHDSNNNYFRPQTSPTLLPLNRKNLIIIITIINWWWHKCSLLFHCFPLQKWASNFHFYACCWCWLILSPFYTTEWRVKPRNHKKTFFKRKEEEKTFFII